MDIWQEVFKNDTQGLKNLSKMMPNYEFEAGDDKFKALYPKVDWELQLVYAEELGLGKRGYNLIQI